MTDTQSDKALWRLVKNDLARPFEGGVGAEGPAGVGPDPLALAAWLDGRLAGPERDAIEAWLAHNPGQLEIAIAAAEARGLAAVWPKRAEQRALALVPAARPPLRFLSAAAAAVILVAVSGFEIGRYGSQELADDGPADLASDLGLAPDFDAPETLL